MGALDSSIALTQFNRRSWQDEVPQNTVCSLHQGRDGRLWIGTRNGLDIYNGSTFVNLSTGNGLSSNVIRAILKDSNGDVWIATGKNGLDRWRDGEITVFTSEIGFGS